MTKANHRAVREAVSDTLSDFDRMFEEQFPQSTDPTSAMARRAVEHVAAHDRKQMERPKARQS